MHRTTYGPDHVFTNFGYTAGFVNNIYSYLDYDFPSTTSLASACDEAEMALTYSDVLDYTNGNWTPLNPKSQWGYYTPIRAVNYFLANARGLTFEDNRYDLDYEEQMNRYRRYQYEVRLLRAYYYFLLVRAYGDIPFTTEVLTEEEAQAAPVCRQLDLFHDWGAEAAKEQQAAARRAREKKMQAAMLASHTRKKPSTGLPPGLREAMRHIST